MTSPSVHGLVDHLFRHQAGQMVATLTRLFGPEHLSLAEEVVQDALVTALQQWSVAGTPENPAAWLFRVARNRALDHLRRGATLRDKEPLLISMFDRAAAAMDNEDAAFAHELRDDQLRMMLMCCHPAIPRESRIALTLKTVSGFGVDEIAREFLSKKETIAQRLVRAKKLIREEQIPIELPSRGELADRVTSVLDVLYLLFNEGYSAHAGEELVRGDLCDEAIRLCRQVVDHPLAGSPMAHALLALMLFQSARLTARVDGAGELATLEQQDRARWDQRLIAGGLRHLDASASGNAVTAYHVEAAIAATHAVARSFAETDWRRIVELYGDLLSMKPTAVVALNRAIAIAMADGAAAGMQEAERVAADGTLRDYLPLAATLGELSLRAGDRTEAAAHFSRALELPSSMPEKRFLLRKLEQCRES